MRENYKKLAKLLCRHSTKIKAKENVLIDACAIPSEMICALVEEIRTLKAFPHLSLSDESTSLSLLENASQEELKIKSSLELAKMKKMDAFIALRGSNNIYENSQIASKQMNLIRQEMKAVTDYRVNHTKWVVLRWPTAAMAQQAMMGTRAFEKFYFDVCCFDYSKLTKPMNALKKLMEKTDKVHILGKGTDLKFSIKNIPSITCGGQYNIPDGEVFTAPVKNSVEGFVTYNAPSIYMGVSFDNVRLEFSRGKIVKATCSGDNKKLNDIIYSDAGSCYIGEFALGFNPFITTPMRDILFDEKIAGSFHFTPGQSYEDASNSNKSKVHWDLVCIQTPEYGGGEIYFDGKLIRKNGLFVEKSVVPLNPKNLI